MKYLKGTLMILGGVFFVAAAAIFVKVYFFDLKALWSLASSNSSIAYSDPRPWFIVTSIGLLIGGLLFGIGLALTRTTFATRYTEVRKEEKREEADRAGIHGASAAPASLDAPKRANPGVAGRKDRSGSADAEETHSDGGAAPGDAS